MSTCRRCWNETERGSVLCIACTIQEREYGEPVQQDGDNSADMGHIYSLGDDGPPTNPGFLVTTASGVVGRTFHTDELVNGKVVVHTANGKLLCRRETLHLSGYID